MLYRQLLPLELLPISRIRVGQTIMTVWTVRVKVPTCGQEVEDGAGGHVVEGEDLLDGLLVGVALLDGGDEVPPEVVQPDPEPQLGVEELLRPVGLPADLLDGAVGVLELLRQVGLLPFGDY